MLIVLSNKRWKPVQGDVVDSEHSTRMIYQRIMVDGDGVEH